MPSSELLAIIDEWRRLKLIKNIKSWHCKGITVSFNQTMSLMFTIVFSLLCACLMMLVYYFISVYPFRNLLMIIIILSLGVPWVFYLKYSRTRMTWITSIAWVAGTIISIMLSILGIMKIL